MSSDLTSKFHQINLNGIKSNSALIYEFEGFRLDVEHLMLYNDGEEVSLTPKQVETLLALLERNGEIISKSVLMDRLWGDAAVEESNLIQNIYILRKVLGERENGKPMIETLRRRGYRFNAELKPAGNGHTVPANPGSLVDTSAASTGLQPLGAGRNALQNGPFGNFANRSVVVAALGIVTMFAALGYSVIFRAADEGNNNSAESAPVLLAPFSSEELSTDGKVYHAVISPDGKKVVYTHGLDMEKESIWLRQIDSGANIELIPPSDDIYGGLAFSPDGNFIYFTRRPRKVDRHLDIYRLPISGGVPTKVIDEAKGRISASPDGNKISFVRCYYRDDEYCSLWVADSSNGKNERKILSRPSRIRISDIAFSPDGHSIAFAVGQSENQANDFELSVVDVESGIERELSGERFFDIKNIAWLPDSGGLLFTASQMPDQTFRIRRLSTATGKTTLLTKDSHSYSGLALDKDARLLAATRFRKDFRLKVLNLENVTAERKVLAEGYSAAFAPSGKLVFSSAMSGNSDIWTANADGGERLQLTNHIADDQWPIVSSFDDSIIFMSSRSGRAQVWRMNPDGSDQIQLTVTEGGFPLAVSSDGKWVYYQSARQKTIWRVSVEGGDEQVVFDKRSLNHSISPDGLTVASPEMRNDETIIAVSSLMDGTTIKIFRLAEQKAALVEMGWTPDGKNLAYILMKAEPESRILWFQPLNDETVRQIADLGKERIAESWGFAFSQDGKQLVFGQGSWKHDAVLIGGLK